MSETSDFGTFGRSYRDSTRSNPPTEGRVMTSSSRNVARHRTVQDLHPKSKPAAGTGSCRKVLSTKPFFTVRRGTGNCGEFDQCEMARGLFEL